MKPYILLLILYIYGLFDGGPCLDFWPYVFYAAVKYLMAAVDGWWSIVLVLYCSWSLTSSRQATMSQCCFVNKYCFSIVMTTQVSQDESSGKVSCTLGATFWVYIPLYAYSYFMCRNKGSTQILEVRNNVCWVCYVNIWKEFQKLFRANFKWLLKNFALNRYIKSRNTNSRFLLSL